jgi:hypothetical protein
MISNMMNRIWERIGVRRKKFAFRSRAQNPFASFCNGNIFQFNQSAGN